MNINIKSFTFRHLSWAALFLLVLVVVLFSFTQIKVTSYKNISSNKTFIPKESSLLMLSNWPKGNVEVSLELEVPALASRKLGLRLDDCLKQLQVNGKWVSLEKDLNIKPLCLNPAGHILDLGNYLKTGHNNILFIVENKGGEGGLYIIPPSFDFWNSLLVATVALLLSILIGCLWQKSFLSIRESLLVSGASFIAYLILVKTPVEVRAHDLTGHLDYITILIHQLHVPLPKECWECFHAPTYYILSAIIVKISNSLSSAYHTLLALQLFSYVLMFAFLYLLRKIWSSILNPNFMYILLLSILTTPTFFIYAPRIGNDLLFYPTALLCVIGMQRYWQTTSNRDLLILNFLLVFAFSVKVSSLALLMTYCLLLLATFIRTYKTKTLDLESKNSKHTLIIVCFGFLAITSTYFMKNIIYNLPMKAFEGNNLHSGLKIKHGIKYFLGFDFINFFNHPHAVTFNTNSDRDYFLNSFIKSFNVGEFKIATSFSRFLIHIRNVCVLILYFISTYSWLCKKNRKYLLEYFPIFLVSFSLVFSLMAYQWIYPFSIMSNSRMNYPFIVGIVSLAWVEIKLTQPLLYVSIGTGVLFWISFFLTSQF